MAAFFNARLTLSVCTVVYLSYLLPILLFDHIEIKVFINNNQFQIYTIILCTTFNHYLYKSRISEILNRLTIQKQSEELKVQEDAKRTFIGNITHDLKTPLSVISGHADILRTSFTKESIESKYLDYIGNSIVQINRLLDMLISIALLDSKDEKPIVELYNYPLFIKEFCDQFTVQGEKRNVAFHVEIPDEKIVAAIDNIWLERIVGNLIQNSFKFTPEGGTIKIRMLQDQQFVYTEVIDSGCGIPEDKLSKVFERKYQAHDDKKHLGYGLGLAIVKEMVSRQGGTIEASSKIGEGTTMRFSLPVYCNQFANVKNSPFSGSDRRSGVDRRQENRVKMIQAQIEQDKFIEKTAFDISKYENIFPSQPTILICEDTPGQLHLLIECLKDDFNLLFAENGIGGLAKLEKAGTKIKLILSDVKMPEMNGIELCKKVFEQEKNKNIPFIFLTAYANDREQLQGLHYGATDYLQKPFNKAILLEKLHHWLTRREHEEILENLVSTLEIKNSEVSQLRSIISHEIRNPLMILNSVHYNLNKLRTKYLNQNDPKEIKNWDSLETIFMVINTINGVLDSAKIIESGVISSTIQQEEAYSLIDESIVETSHLCQNVKLNIVNLTSKRETVYCDKRLITQVFVNLIRNAKEAIEEKRQADGIISIFIDKKGDFIHFAFKDNGAGIPESRMNDLFRYRYTTKKDGTGIGLYFSKRILKVHNGDVIVESKLGEGTTFIVILPQLINVIHINNTEENSKKISTS
jgi:signal transduction histidine kinase